MQYFCPPSPGKWYLFKEISYQNYQTFNIKEFFSHLFENYLTTYSNIMKLIEIIYSIPFSSECEHGFSKKILLKNIFIIGLKIILFIYYY